MKELKPCPFCGGKAKFLVKTFSERGTTRGWLFGISCAECGVETPRSKYKIELSFESNGEVKTPIDEREMAIEAWNRRVNHDG